MTFIGSAGVAALVRLRYRCQHKDCTFAIEAASDAVERVLQLVDLHDLLLGSVVPTTHPVP